jgi:acyl-CoA synthetase (NDP forming)/GNAT superfamily N-acetyltransferase
VTVAQQARVVLADGTVARLRPLDTTDRAALRGLHEALPEQDRYFRFFGRPSSAALGHLLDRLVGAGNAQTLALGMFLDEHLVGVGHFDVLARPEVAEVAFVVAHAVHARGVGTLLLEHLASAARRRGIRRFVADVLAENTAMAQVFTESGLPCRIRSEGTTAHVVLDLDSGDRYWDRTSERERTADIGSLRHLLRPGAVAVIGAGRRPTSVGNAILRNITAGGYPGACYPINPNATEVNGLPAVASIRDVPGPVDLAVVCVPASSVPGVAQDCGRQGVRALLVISAGITDRPELAERTIQAVRRHGMRLVGPNCLGVLNSDPAVALNATFARGMPRRGSVGMVTQSGGVGIAVLDRLRHAGLGVSTLVSTGDKYDVSGNDLLMWWERDAGTTACVLYLESFGNPRKFSRLARRVAAAKPVIVLNAGSSPVAQRAAASHTAATVTPGVTRDALLQQAGVIAVNRLDELMAVLGLFHGQPLPAGSRVAVVTNAGGLGVLAADACVHHGLAVPELPAKVRTALAESLPAQASLRNPVDTTAGIDDAGFARCMRTVLEDPGIDAMIVPVIETAIGDPSTIVADTVSDVGKPVLLVRTGQAETITGAGGGLPVFADPALAAAALAHLARYARWRSAPRGVVPDLPHIDIDSARTRIARWMTDQPHGGWLEPAQVQDVLRCFGLPIVEATIAGSETEAVAAFRRSGTPVAVKGNVEGLLHKSKAGAVLLDVATESQVRSAWTALRDRFGAALRSVTVQPMAAPGREFLVGVTSEPSFGPLVTFGVGGVDTDIVADRSHRLVPVTDRDAADLLAGLRSSPRLFGAHAERPLDTAAMVDVLLRVARMADLLPEIAEVDLNPVIAAEQGCRIVDARIRLQPREPADPFLRRLRL